jgi:hypothetical protein
VFSQQFGVFRDSKGFSEAMLTASDAQQNQLFRKQ